MRVVCFVALGSPLPLAGPQCQLISKAPFSSGSVCFPPSQERTVGLADLFLPPRKWSLGSSFIHLFTHSLVFP